MRTIYIETNRKTFKKEIPDNVSPFSYDLLLQLQKEHKNMVRAYYIEDNTEEEIQIYGEEPYKEIADTMTYYGEEEGIEVLKYKGYAI